MRPLDPLVGKPSVEELLRIAPPDEVRAELIRLAGLGLEGGARAALAYAQGALALREGRLDEACRALDQSVDELARHADPEAAALARCEAWLAKIRRGPRIVYADAAAGLEEIAAQNPTSRIVQVVSLHYRGTALRYAGQPEATLRVLLDAFARSDGLLGERAQVLNSLGTLYVVLGAYGAAHAVLEHAAELNHQTGDKVGEAISYGQLGSAALAMGELDAARRHLQRQEWLASRLGDTFGQSRALTLLADLAIDMGRPDDALKLGEHARTVASSVQPPLGMWVAYSSRTIARAKLELGDTGALEELEAARERFRKIGNQLGEAMVEWDLARQEARSAQPGAADTKVMEHWVRTTSAFATLGLTARVAQVLGDLRLAAPSEDAKRSLELAIGAVSQVYPHLCSAQEVELVYNEPDILSVIATRRIEGQRNLGRLAALTLAPAGLHIAVIASAGIGTPEPALPSRRACAALVGQVPGLATWVWSKNCAATEIARDLSSLRAASGEAARAAVGFFPQARIAAAPFAGELGARLDGADLSVLTRTAVNAEPATLWRDPALAWDNEAEALTRLAGYAASIQGAGH
jgi:tetratricopeptide (TPR) repeat protein